VRGLAEFGTHPILNSPRLWSSRGCETLPPNGGSRAPNIVTRHKLASRPITGDTGETGSRYRPARGHDERLAGATNAAPSGSVGQPSGGAPSSFSGRRGCSLLVHRAGDARVEHRGDERVTQAVRSDALAPARRARPLTVGRRVEVDPTGVHSGTIGAGRLRAAVPFERRARELMASPDEHRHRMFPVRRGVGGWPHAWRPCALFGRDRSAG
jgi:hypothetical protein